MPFENQEQDLHAEYHKASIQTANDLKSVAYTLVDDKLSALSLPEIDGVIDIVSNVLPAGNIPGLILNGLSRLPGRKPPQEAIQRDIDVLFRGINRAFDKVAYGALFAGPAAVIWGYQNLLKLAGKDTEDAFPEGTWQFYVNYALREDTARHTNETHGFDTLLRKHNLQLSDYDRITALIMTAIGILHDYPLLLANEWRERVYIHVLTEIVVGTRFEADFTRAYRDWEIQRPYQRGRDALSSESYVIYRKRKFNAYFESLIEGIDADLRYRWLEIIQSLKAIDLPAYQNQMSILAYLKADTFHEIRTPLPISKAHIGIVVDERYYLFPVCESNTEDPIDVSTIRKQVISILKKPANTPPAQLVSIAQVQRANLPEIFKQVNANLFKDLQALRMVPIIINFDQHDPAQSLSHIRQAERGIGNHALTIFVTSETLVFDQSHIFFDGAWGAILAEVMTNEASSWAVYLNSIPEHKGKVTVKRPYSPAFRIKKEDMAHIKSAPKIMPESSAENHRLNFKRLQGLRRLFKQRSDLLRLTVNDLLVLYRAIHAVTYEPARDILEQLDALKGVNHTYELANQTLKAITPSKNTPTILIPIDASLSTPRERLYPMIFEVPLAELNLLQLHHQVISLLIEYQNKQGNNATVYAQFDAWQRQYLATLAGFGEVLSKAKEIANSGDNASVATIKLLAHMPMPLQRLLDRIPQRFDMLNDMIKGREVFSNIGAVAKTSTLTRFISAKDDNEKKTLVWGVMTDASGTVQITLRDFRPHVKSLKKAGYSTLAQKITQDYLDTYVSGLNQYILDLYDITVTSRKLIEQPGEAND